MIWLLSLLVVPIAVAAQTMPPARNSPHAKPSREAEHRAEDIARHRQIARAHEEAARCLEGGAPEKQCQERLRETCKGIAIGQYCGMRHGE